MLEARTKLIHERALALFGMKAKDVDALFSRPKSTDEMLQELEKL
jgi:hypothetical protein